MKTLKLISLLVLVTLGMSSCTSEDNDFLIQDQTAKSLLNSYEISRNIDGSYYLDYGVTGATSENIIDKKSGDNNIMLYPNNTEVSKAKSEDLGLISSTEQLRINFNDTKNDKVTSIKVIDDNIQLGRNQNSLLKDFSFEAKEDGTYDLDFEVKKGVEVEFVYNDELESYDIHLSKGDSTTESNYFRTFTPNADGYLRIAFVTTDNSSRTTTRRPEVIVGEGND